MSLKHRSEMEDYFRLIENKPETIVREQQFMDNLRTFYRQKWNCILKPPNVNGKPLNLYKLYTSVIERGGWIKVCSNDKWKEIAIELNFDEDSAMIDAGLKLLYTRYLSKYEEVQTIGELDEHEVDIFGKGRVRSQFVNNECPISQSYREKRRDVLESEYARIVKSLYSGFPNEVDFCYNILTLMIAPGPYTLRLEKCPLLIALLIAHAGVFGDNVHLRELSEYGWKKYRDRGFEKFWLSSGINDEDVLALIPINSKSLKENKYIEEFFTVEGDYNPKNETRFRIYQTIAHLRNMSFEPSNQIVMGKSDILIQFMTICASSKHVVFAKEAMETLANIAAEIDLITPDGDYLHCLTLKLLADHLMGDDKHRVLQSLEIIGNLCQNDRNESVCTEFISNEILNRLFNLVSVKDILLCIYTLEALYQISELGRLTCNKIANHPTAINQLISLVTTEAASFGKSGLSGIQVVESLPNQHQLRQHYPPPQITNQQQFRQPYPPTQHQYGPQQPTTPKYQIPRPTTRVVVQPPVAFAHDEKLKNLTAKWIKEHLIPEPGSTAVRGDVYSNYVDYMKNVHSIMSGSVQMFTSILQTAIPCTIKSEQQGSTMVYMIEGVKFIKPPQQQVSQVAANHPVMQKILTTPKASPVPRPPSATTIVNSTPQTKTNGVPLPKAPSVEPKQNDDKEKTISRSVTPSNSVSTENGSSKEENSTNVKLEICSDAVEAKTLIPENEQHETKIIRVENTGMMETNGDESTTLSQKIEKVMNGKVRPKGRPRKFPKEVNGGCNGIGNGHGSENDKTVVAESETKENGDLHETVENGVVSEEISQESSNKIDDSIEAVCKATPKNGLKNKGRKRKNTSIDEDGLTNGSEVVEKKRRSPVKKARLSEVENSESISQDGTVINTEVDGDAQVPSTSRDYMCEWNACGQMFSSVETIMAHHLTDHTNNLQDESNDVIACMWPTCDGTKRGKWSLITHIQDHHCQEHILKQSIIKRNEMGGNQAYLTRIKQQLIDRPKENMAQVPFAPTAANEAIRRHAYTNIQREIIDEQEGPVTKCIRLTSALILRNIARYSEEGRIQLRRYESHLFPLALSRLEAGATLAQCLSELQGEENNLTNNSDGINEQRLYPRI